MTREELRQGIRDTAQGTVRLDELADSVLDLFDCYEMSRRCEACALALGSLTPGHMACSYNLTYQWVMHRKDHGCRAWQPKEDGR